VHQEKIKSILDWPMPRNVLELRRFFGICNYYRQLVKSFSHLGAPLTDLTRHGDFIWNEESQKAFDHMKEFMGICLVLALSDFTLLFVLECDASGEGIEAVLMWGGNPFVFERRKLS
jgi:hypothetical protein